MALRKMNSIIKSALRVSSNRNFLYSPSQNTSQSVNYLSRALSSTCVSQNRNDHILCSRRIHRSNDLCKCCTYRSAHSKAEKELVEFLAEEILAEKKAQKAKTIPTELDGFKVNLDGAEVTLEKRTQSETITISFNVNHTVDTQNEPDVDPRDDQADIGEMKSKPTFNLDITRGSQTLSFVCSFNNEPGASGADDSYNDIFGIDEISLYEGEHNDKVYAVAGEIVDGYLYDLLMNYLEEKGISNEFAEKLINLSTNYEHNAYVSLLEGLSKFTAGK